MSSDSCVVSVHRSASSPTWRTDVISSCGKTYRSVTCLSATLSRAVLLVVGSAVLLVVGSAVSLVVGSAVSLVVGSAVSLVVGSAVSLVVGNVAVVENCSRLALGCDWSHSGKTNQQRPYSIISQHLSNKPVRICAFPLA